MKKNIVICLDGTWNKPDKQDTDHSTETNVRSLFEWCETNDRQVAYYDQGVGTNWYNRVLGGVTGLGLSENIRQAYRYLSRVYQLGDKVFIFGFSRGAYTARSLAGMLYSCGLPLSEVGREESEEIFDYYRNRGRDEQRKLKAWQQPCPVEVLGVWDTVGALGIPLGPLNWFFLKEHQFHDVKLNREVKAAYHAIAIDEERKTFTPTLWKQSRKHEGQMLEQVWFAGVHSDVGGGYPERDHSNVAFQWLLERAVDRGLILKHTFEFENDLAQDIHNSYRFWFGPRATRRAEITESETSLVHNSVQAKLGLRPDYLPRALYMEYDRKTLNPYQVWQNVRGQPVAGVSVVNVR